MTLCEVKLRRANGRSCEVVIPGTVSGFGFGARAQGELNVEPSPGFSADPAGGRPKLQFERLAAFEGGSGCSSS